MKRIVDKSGNTLRYECAHCGVGLGRSAWRAIDFPATGHEKSCPERAIRIREDRRRARSRMTVGTASVAGWRTEHTFPMHFGKGVFRVVVPKGAAGWVFPSALGVRGDGRVFVAPSGRVISAWLGVQDGPSCWTAPIPGAVGTVLPLSTELYGFDGQPSIVDRLFGGAA